ncbi:MAG: hypothetical protein JEY99_03020 [Spirochaetales bacterium]|nr:hypothetical protein [Spirochaetales bacterium]
MKKATLILTMLLLSMNIYALLPINTSPESIITDIENISKLFPHSQGSDKEKELIKYITTRLTETGVKFSVQDFQNAVGYHSFSQIIQADIPGENEDILVIAIPLSRSNQYSVDNDFGILNIVTGLSMVESLSAHKPPVNIKILFLGGELEDDSGTSLGSKLFLSSFFPISPVAVLYMNFPDRPGKIRLGTGGIGVVSPRWIIEQTTSALNNTSIDYYTLSQETQIFRIGMGSPRGRITPYLANDYPAIYIEGEEGDSSSIDWVNSILYFTNNFLESNQNGFPLERENHYQFVRVSGKTRLISELAYIRFLIFTTLLLVLYPFFARRRFKRYTMLLKKHIWIIPVMVGLVFIFLLLSTLLIEAILRIQNTPDFWQHHAMAFLFLKLTGALTLYWVSHKILKRLPFSRRGNFYSATALLLLIILFVIVCIINISFAYIIMWSLFFAFLFSIFRSRIIKLFCLILSMAWTVYFTYIIFYTPYNELADFLLFSRFAGNGFLALVLLPHIFMSIRLSFLFFIRGRRPRKIMDRIILFTLLFATLLLALNLLITSPFPPETAQPLIIRDNIDIETPCRKVSLESPAPFTLENLSYEDEFFTIDPHSRVAEMDCESIPPSPEIKTELSSFLGRKEIKITINSLEDQNPSRIDLTLISLNQDELILLDSNFPYSLDSESGTAVILLGSNPPMPLILSFILPGDQVVEGQFEIHFSPPVQIEVQGDKKFAIEKKQIFNFKRKLIGE